MSELISLNMGNLTAAVDPMGAQLCSLKLNQNEYLWQGNPAFWSRRAPILFPIVGSLRNGRAESAQGPCTMGRHGIARNYEHSIESRDEFSVTFKLASNKETLEAYPFRFTLKTTYSLVSEQTLSQTFCVANDGSVPMPFCIGGHPAFNVPVPGAVDESFEDYVLKFEKPWSCMLPTIGDDGLMRRDELRECPAGADFVQIGHRCFDHDALVFSDVPERRLTLLGSKSNHGVQIDFPRFKYLGVWSAANDAPFVALEPWTGHTTACDEGDVFEEKTGMTILQPGESDTRTFSITLL